MPPTLIADRYHVLRELGRGGMGVVYQVMHRETGEQHALKVLLAHKTAKGDNVERFKRELKLPSRIQSENVVQVIDSGEVREEDGAPFYVMELLRGCDLRKLLDTEHAFKPHEVIWILRQIAQGLSRAHEIGIVHRDLKPDNIFLHCRDEERLVVKILDFGIARYAQELLETGDQAKLTATQAMLGTPLYMAPEQAKGSEGRTEIGPGTDLWAVGMIVFELLTGRTYWSADSVMAHLGQLLFAKMPPASQKAGNLPSGFDDWFARSCNRDTSQRYQSVGEQVDDLAKLLAAGEQEGQPTASLLAVVKKHRPRLVLQDSPTVLSMPAPNIPDPVAIRATKERDARQSGPNAPLQRSAELNLRAEMSSEPQPRAESAPRLNIRVAVGGALILCIGIFALTLSLMKPTSKPVTSSVVMDAGIRPREVTVPPDLAAPADLAPNVQPVEPAAVRKRSRTKAAKPATPPPPSEEPPKSRRTYIPPTL